MVKPSEEEEKYFQQAEIERRKKAALDNELDALNQKEAEGVAEVLGIRDLDLAMDLVELGFSRETAGIFPLLPLVYVAWADGDVTTAERRRVMELAEARGAKPGTPGYDFLSDLLDKPLKQSFFDVCVQTIRQIFENLPEDQAEAAKENLVSLSLSVADTSGGFLGLFGNKVSQEELKVIEEIIDELKLSDSDAAARLLSAVKG